MSTNEGVVFVVSVLAVSVVVCQAQIIAEVADIQPQSTEVITPDAQGVVLSNPLGPRTQLIVPQPEVVADVPGADLSNPLGPVTLRVGPEPQLTEVAAGKRKLRGTVVGDSEGGKGGSRLLMKFQRD